MNASFFPPHTQFPPRIGSNWIFQNPGQVLHEVFHWYLTQSLPTVYPLIFAFFSLFLALALFMRHFPKLGGLLAQIFWVGGIIHHLWWVFTQFDATTFWKDTYGIGDLSGPNNVFLMGPLYLLDFIQMLIVALLRILIEADFVHLLSFGIGGHYALALGVFSTHNKGRSITKGLFFITAALIIFVTWIPYQHQWIRTGLGEDGRLESGFVNPQISYVTTQILVSYLSIIPFLAHYLYSRTTLNTYFATFLLFQFVTLFFAHIAFAAALWIGLVYIQPWGLKSKKDEKKDEKKEKNA